MANIFDAVKEAVPVPMAAERYGLHANHVGMVCCPFHDDHHPSLKLNERYFYCFGCGEKGSVVDLTARLFNLRPYEAANKLAADFGVDASAVAPPVSPLKSFRTDHLRCQRLLDSYLNLLLRWQRQYAPTSPDEEWDDRYVEACQMLVMVDDDMKLEALPQTNYIKTIITADLPLDLEKKSQQSYQGELFCRFLGFGNGSLKALYDRSDGFFRRQIILTTKKKNRNRVDDPYLSDKLIAEKEGIFLWCLEGLRRLIAQDYKFTISERTRENMAEAISDGNNVVDFLHSEGYIELKADDEASSKQLYAVYELWCSDNALKPLSPRSFSLYLTENQDTYNLEATNNIHIAGGKRVRGFMGIRLLQPIWT